MMTGEGAAAAVLSWAFCKGSGRGSMQVGLNNNRLKLILCYRRVFSTRPIRETFQARNTPDGAPVVIVAWSSRPAGRAKQQVDCAVNSLQTP
jgi:hypothetical protein